MAGYWPHSFFASLWTSTSSQSINTQKKNLANIQPSWPLAWSITHTSFFCRSNSNHVNSVKLWRRLAHICSSLSRFLQHVVARSISTPPGRDASPLQVISAEFVRFPQQFAGTHLYSWAPGERHCERYMSHPRTQHSVPLAIHPHVCQIQSVTLNTVNNKNNIICCLFRAPFNFILTSCSAMMFNLISTGTYSYLHHIYVYHTPL